MSNKFPGTDSKFAVGVVDNREKAEDHSGNAKFRTSDHGQGVSANDLALSPMLMSPTGSFQQMAFPGLDSGSRVVVQKQLGDNFGLIFGMPNVVKNGGQGGATSSNLPGFDLITELEQVKRDVNVAPDIQEVEENGVKIRKIKEKGKQHSLDLLEGLPIHGALFDMAGFR